MKLVACRECHSQFDVTALEAAVFDCRCGAVVRNEAHAAVDARLLRCSACGALLREGAQRCDYCDAVVAIGAELSLLCPECYARNAESARFCGACGVEFRPEPLPQEQAAPLACPVCALELAVRGVGGVWVRECAKCHGLWVPGDRFDALVARALESARERAAHGVPVESVRLHAVQRVFSYRNCPVCGSRMHRKNYGQRSGIIVDWCGPDGTWLDADELEHIADFIARGGLRDAPSSGVPGLSSGPRMSVEQFKVIVAGERLLARERERSERASPVAISILDFFTELLR